MAQTESKKLQPFAEIVFPLPVQHAFTYAIPKHLQEVLAVGHRVLAPFGKRKLTGYVVGLTDHTELTDLKEIEDLLDDEPVLSPEMLELTHWIADYYMAAWGEVIDASLPAGINLESRRRVHLAERLTREQILALETITKKQRELLLVLSRKGSQVVNQLEMSQGVIGLNYNLQLLSRKRLITITRELIEPKVRIKYARYLKLAPELQQPVNLDAQISILLQNHSRQAELLHELSHSPAGLAQTDLLRRTKVSNSVLKTAIKNGLILVEEKEVFRDYYSGHPLQEFESISLNTDQKAALQQLINHINTSQFMPVLLFGVTGSGKTQVYIETLMAVRRRNRNAIVLVPEIALTPQTVSRFKAHFGNDVAVLHSRMSNGERYDSWRRIRSGQVHIVIGPRSAIFAPLPNLGLIVVDEEQESSYKQNEMNPRYHARDVALVRGKMNQAIVILGSATPSVESFYNTQSRKYQRLELPRRVAELPLPQVRIVDMRQEWQQYHGQPSTILSRALLGKIAEKITYQEQVILLQNRRGFSTFILCKECGHVERCIHCNITLTYHLAGHRLRCHYCDYQKPAPISCPKCGGVQITYHGTGTQRVEEEIKLHFPRVRVVRMDLDTTTRKGAHDRILHDFREGLYDILLGTQMVAKGLDFPRVSLVGVISADTTLQLPDFRASERTFQLLTQVAGRSGRKGKQGEVIIQTYSPQNHSIIFAQKHDYLRFFTKEVQERKELSYPPFSRLILIEFRGRQEKTVQNTAQRFATSFQFKKYYQLLGPAPAPLAKLKNEHRYHLIIKYDRQLDPQGQATRQEILAIIQRFKHRRQLVKIDVDVDPIDLF